jgi:phytoene dehydrogenase-like protein
MNKRFLFQNQMSLTRREVLTAFLGLPVALAACRTNTQKPLPEGEIVGASDVFGHRVREGLKIELSKDKRESVSVAIVGGGAAGLSAAWRFLNKGFDNFVLLELEKEVGGTARSGESKLISYPWGAHYLPVPMKENANLISLLDEMKIIEGKDKDGEPIVAEQFLCRDPEERVFYKGRWYEGLYLHAGESEEDKKQLNDFLAETKRWVDWRDSKGRRAFTLPVADCSDDAEVTALDKISMGEWMRGKGFNSKRLWWLIDYSCRDDYGLTIEQTSAWAGLFYFCSRVPKAGEESQSLITFPEGNGRFINYLREKAKTKIKTNTLVVEIIPNENSLDVMTIDSTTNEARGFRAKKVIFAAPHFTSRFVIRDWRDNPPKRVAEFQHGAWMVANLHLKDRPKIFSRRDYPLCWDNILYESPSLGYVVATHQKGLDRGATVFTYYYPLCDDNPKDARNKLLSNDRNAWADITLTDLQKAHPDIRELTTRLDVMRWGHAMIRPRPNFIWSDARQEGMKPYRNIHFAHSDLSGLALFEEAFYHGLRAADEVL